MSVDFFKTSCQTTTCESIFGLYDSDDGTPATIKLTDESTWNARVLNQRNRNILFTSIDNCIEIFNENDEMLSRCDCMITYESTLLLIELKNKRGAWQSEGLNQIENIAEILNTDFPDYLSSFKRRKAIVANRKNQFPSFHNSNLEQRQRFMSK